MGTAPTTGTQRLRCSGTKTVSSKCLVAEYYMTIFLIFTITKVPLTEPCTGPCSGLWACLARRQGASQHRSYPALPALRLVPHPAPTCVGVPIHGPPRPHPAPTCVPVREHGHVEERCLPGVLRAHAPIHQQLLRELQLAVVHQVDGGPGEGCGTTNTAVGRFTRHWNN